jgi:hypothetical protein
MTRTFGERVAAKKPKQELRVGRINTLGGVASELGRVYRAVRHKKLDSVEGYRLSSILTALAKCLEASEVERRLAAIEDAVLGRQRFQPKVITFAPNKDEGA